MTITEFLLARIAEDEADANRGRSHPDPTTFARDNYGYLWVQPARVLAECEAKRRILDDWEALTEENDGSERDRAMIDNLNDVMEYLAAVYADHPDYRDEWRP